MRPRARAKGGPSNLRHAVVLVLAAGLRSAGALGRGAPLVGGAAAIAVLGGCKMNPERLPELDRRFYYNLETPEDQRAFLELRDDERQAFLEKRGLWDKWIALPADQRKRVLESDVRPGDEEFAAFMAWGPPADTMLRDRDGRNVRVHTFIRCTSGPKAGRYVRNNLDCDGTSAETQISVVGSTIAEIEYPH